MKKTSSKNLLAGKSFDFSFIYLIDSFYHISTLFLQFKNIAHNCTKHNDSFPKSRKVATSPKSVNQQL
jgi:hypothetical protein